MNRNQQLQLYRHGSEEEEETNDTLTPEDSCESAPSSTFNDVIKMTSTTCSPKKRRGLQKRVVSVPMKEVEGTRLRGESAPPSDSWAWRKYGQKPIKGSPYPRGYYRCSSSKGCPARKQVERSSVDPTMLLITYSCEHNHPWPLPSSSRNHHHHPHPHPDSSSKAASASKPDPEQQPEQPEEKISDPPAAADHNCILTTSPDEEFTWFGELETTTSTILESPIFAERTHQSDSENLSMYFPMREEDESLFADLGELPECSLVFRRHRKLGPEVQIC